VTNRTRRDAGTQAPRQWMNLFEVTNGEDLALPYRLLQVQGLLSGENYDKLVNRLLKSVRYEMKRPVALVRRGDDHYLAVPADGPLPNLEQRLMPHVANLVPQEGVHQLDFTRLDETTRPIALAFLQFALGGPLHRHQNLWKSGRAYFGKQPLNAGDRRSTVDVYPGFNWSVIATEEGRIFLSVDTTTRYVDRRWLLDAAKGQNPDAFLRRHCLYHFGHQWYVVQLWALTNRTIAQQRFLPEGKDQTVDVFTYTKECWERNPPPWVRDLDPNSPAVLYRYPGNEKERYGALALCKLSLSTREAEAAGLHRYSTPDPARRFEQIMAIVKRHFQGASLGGQPIEVSAAPRAVERRVFSVPAQRFGHGRVLAVGQTAADGATDVVQLDQIGQRRLKLLLDPKGGPLDTTPFDPQYILVPQSSPRPINDDFKQRLELAMREVSGQQHYRLQQILYDDRGANSLCRQVEAIRAAISANGISRGYALLVLPERTHRDLHNYIKRSLWPNIQFQCALASKVRGCYEPAEGGRNFRPASGQGGRLVSYVRNCALGLMAVNRKWPWALAAPLHYEVYIGIDVLNGMAGLTFVYDQGRRIFFRNYPCKQKERLTKKELTSILLKHLREDLADQPTPPASIIIARDGRSFASELEALRGVVRQLNGEGVLPWNVQVGAVDIRKSSADHLRLVEGRRIDQAGNPTVGSWWTPGTREGIVCTTGWPFRFPGTAKPLSAVVSDGELIIEWVLEDLFALSQLIFTAPDKCSRLPIMIKLADDFLEPIAGDADEEEALYESEDAEEADGDAPLPGRNGAAETQPDGR